MEYHKFVQQIVLHLNESLPENLHGAEVTAQRVDKPQGSYYGICIRPAHSNQGAICNPTDLYWKYVSGMEFEDVLCQIVERMEKALQNLPFHNEQELVNYPLMKEKLVLQTIPVKGNEKLLEGVPHRLKEDLALVYRFALQEDEQGFSSILVTNHLLELYRITPEQLHQDALIAAQKTHPLSIRSLLEILAERMNVEIPAGGPDLLVASTGGNQNGAACLFYPDFPEQAALKIGGSYYILPSSLHEVILVPETMGIPPAELENLVCTVNGDVVPPEERLTDTVYHYDVSTHRFETAKACEQRNHLIRRQVS